MPHLNCVRPLRQIKTVLNFFVFQDVMKGVQLVYDFARRSSQMPGAVSEEAARQQQNFLRPPELNVDGLPSPGENFERAFLKEYSDVLFFSPETPALSQFDIDDEFNLPISVAITILVAYIFIGASVYCLWEEWSFFESFYFVFISMSTIGFGDYVPHVSHPLKQIDILLILISASNVHDGFNDLPRFWTGSDVNVYQRCSRKTFRYFPTGQC